jgi:hypothetical protein
MSDISALSHEYETSAKLEDLNEAILTIKKSRVHQSAGLTIDQRRALAITVEALWQQLDPDQGSSQEEFLPQEILARLHERNSQRMPYFLDDLSRTAKTLEDESMRVDEPVIRVLDEICDAADATASAVFRRMRRR